MALQISHIQQPHELILDSGATTSMFNNLSFFPHLEKCSELVYLADRSQVPAAGHGTARIEFANTIITLKNSLFVPNLSSNLVSLGTFIKNGVFLTSDGKSCFKLVDPSNTIITGSLELGNFVLDRMSHSAYSINLKSNLNKLNILHQAAGHPSIDYFYKMFPHLPQKEFSSTTCDISKRHKEPFKSHFPTPKQKLDFVHINLYGPISPPSISRYKYLWDSSVCWMKFWTSSTKILRESGFLSIWHFFRSSSPVDWNSGGRLNRAHIAMTEWSSSEGVTW